LEANGSDINDTIFAFVLGTTEDNQPFIFEPYQELLKITEISVFNFKNVIRIDTGDKNANRISTNT
jgi:hypothetical protein